MERVTTIYSSVSLASDGTVADITAAPIRDGRLSIHAVIHNGAGIAPTDSPVGVWELWVSSDNVTFYQLTSAAIVSALAPIAAVGDTLVSEWVIFENTPGKYLKLRYNQTSGGLTSGVALIHISS
jgi:hypothetical protein